MWAPMATAIPRLVPAPLATVALPSASVWALVTALELIASAPAVVTLPPVVSTKACVPLLTVPTATAPARLTLPLPVLALLLVSWVCD